MNITYEPAHPKPTRPLKYGGFLSKVNYLATVDGVDIYVNPDGTYEDGWQSYFITPNARDPDESDFSYVSVTALNDTGDFFKKDYPPGPLEFLQMLHKLNQ